MNVRCVLAMAGVVCLAPILPAIATELNIIEGGNGVLNVLSMSPPSNDGRLVGGSISGGSGIAAAGWVQGGKLEPLGPTADRFYYGGYANAISANGSFLAGFETYAHPADPSTVFNDFFVWSEAKGYEPISLAGMPDFRPTGVANNGDILAGIVDLPGDFDQTALWTRGEGFKMLSAPADQRVPRALSADGKVIAGAQFLGDEIEAYRWSEGTGFVNLSAIDPALTEASVSRAITGNAILGIVGESPFIWTGDSVEVLAVDLPGRIVSMGADPADPAGTLVVLAQLDNDPLTRIWTPAGGLRTLQDYLVNELGVDTKGLTDLGGSRVSVNGLSITGVGTAASGRYEDWVVTVPEPSTLALAGMAATCLLVRTVRRARGASGNSSHSSAAHRPRH